MSDDNGKSGYKVRYIAITDIQKKNWNPYTEIDDVESLVRLLLYSNEIQIEGIIPCTSVYKKKIRKSDVACVHEVIQAYGQAWHNLKQHADGFPTEKMLHGAVKRGIPSFGKKAGCGFASRRYNQNEGVRHIINVVDKDDSRPVWIGLWGGANTLAQAIWQVEQERSLQEMKLFLAKLRIYGISDQDAASRWMRNRYGKHLFYIVSPSIGTVSGNGKTFCNAVWPGISCDEFSHGSEDGISGGGFTGACKAVIQKEWLKEHIADVGSYGACYPLPVFCMEGDSPSFMGLIDNGLNEPEHPEYGGWGGRYEYKIPQKLAGMDEEICPVWTNSTDRVMGEDRKEHCSPQASIWRWRRDFQMDFASRMQWTVTADYAKGVHRPVVSVDCDDRIEMKAGECRNISAVKSHDKNGRNLEFQWFVYGEAGSCRREVELAGNRMPTVCVKVPEESEAGETVHLILAVRGKEEVFMTSYKRIVIEIRD